jgi:hypothetical protein
MTLAVILLVSIVCAPWTAKARPTASQAAPATQSTETTATQDAGTVPPSQKPAAQPPPPSTATPPKTSTGQTAHSSSKKPRHKKKAVPANCDNASPAPASTPPTPNSTPTDSSPGSASTPESPTPCAPPKVIVRQGGTSEPSIQVAGGATDGQTLQQRNTANEMLDVADGNLKKISGRQLSSEQQEMVNQIHQFMTQSKSAVKDGDLERARTLAWKAQLLSEDLVKPEK